MNENIMSCCCVLVLLLSQFLPRATGGHPTCQPVDVVDFSVADTYVSQPYFVSFINKTPDIVLVDNICCTVFPLPDDPDTFDIFCSSVYCDGSNAVTTRVVRDVGVGTNIQANPFATVQDFMLGYAGCGNHVVYRCPLFGGPPEPIVFGISTDCRTLGLSCLRKVEEIVRANGLPDQDYYVLPMKLPHRCVTQLVCLQPPNPFYNELPNMF